MRGRRAERRLAAPWGRAWVILGLAGGQAAGLTGCGTIEPVAPAAAPITDPTQLYMQLTLDHPAVTLDTATGYNTLQLTATPRDALGNAMAGLPAPSYRSSDTASVTVTATGLVTARQPTQGVQVIATLPVGPVTHADTAVINVTTLTAPPPPLASLSIHPVQGDSAVWGINFGNLHITVLYQQVLSSVFPSIGSFFGPYSRVLVPRTADATGAAISGLPFDYASLDPAVATVDRRSGQVQLIRPGQVRLVAQTTAYGITQADTATFTITLPLMDEFLIQPGQTGAPALAVPEVRIRPYGLVAWENFVDDSVDVVFDDPTNVAMPPTEICDPMSLLLAFGYLDPGSSCGAGDLVVTPHLDQGPYGAIQLRQFPVPGVYPFHSTRLGASGRVIVTADPSGN